MRVVACFLKNHYKISTMKTQLLLSGLLLSLGSYCFSQKAELGLYVPIDLPNKTNMPKMSTAGGFGVSFGYSPLFLTPFYIEAKTSFSNYSSQNLQQTYQFDDGSQTITNVSYSSGMSKYLLGAKTMIGQDFRAVRGFITPQIGLASMRTKIVIADPQDADGCQPLDRNVSQRFTGAIYGGEIGAEIALEKLFRKITIENAHKLYFSMSYLRGMNHFEYVNVKYMQDEVHNTMTTHPKGDINASFINVYTNNIHEHKIAELYHTPFEMIGINFGYIVRF